MLLQLGADDAELAGDVGAAGADLVLAGDHVELIPGVAAVHNALGAQDHAVSALVQRVQGLVQILTAVFVGRFLAPAREHLVGVVVVVVVMMAAGADTVLVVVVLVVMLVLILVVIIVMVMAAAVVVVVIVVIVVMVVMMMLVLVLVVIVIMMVAAAVVVVLVLIVVMMVMMVVLMLILVGMGHVGGAGLGQQLGDEVGIRIENELECIDLGENQYGHWLGFAPLTLVPISTEPVLVDELSRDQINWLNDYHAHVYEMLSPRLTEDEKAWLKEKCAPIGR